MRKKSPTPAKIRKKMKVSIDCSSYLDDEKVAEDLVELTVLIICLAASQDFK